MFQKNTNQKLKTMKDDENRVDPEIEQAWIKEAERRLDEIESGEAETIPGPKAMKELKKIAEE